MQSTITVGGYLLTLQTANADYLKKFNYPDFLHIRMVRRPN